MEATFVVKPEELTPEWVEQLKSRFAEDGIITITASGPRKPLFVGKPRYDPQEVLKRMAETRQKHPPTKIPADVDINKIIDEMYWEGNH